MTPEFALYICRQAILTVLLIAGPLLMAGLVVGVVISILQAVTQIHEMTLTFIPKILAVIAVILFLMPWMIRILLGFVNLVMGYIASGTG